MHIMCSNTVMDSIVQSNAILNFQTVQRVKFLLETFRGGVKLK